MRQRSLSIVTLLLIWAAVPLCAGEPKTLLLVGQSPDNHPPQTHEYMPGMKRLAELLEPRDDVNVRIVNGDEPWAEGPAALAEVDGAVFFVSEGARWCLADPRRYDALARLAARGGGLAVLHWGMGTRSAEPIAPFVKLFGGCHGGPDRKYKVVDTELRVVDPMHPATAGLSDFRARDEYYYRLKFAAPSDAIRPLLKATIDGQPETVAWAYERPDGGRSFGFSGLHFHDNWERPEYRALVSQGALWTVGLPAD
mgnify:FL=1